MCVLSLLDLPAALPLGCFTGQFGTQAVLEELNNTWRNSGSGVIFGQDAFSDRFQAFSNMIATQAQEIENTVLKTIEAVSAPNKIQEITCREDLHNIPVSMYIPILTMPAARTLFEAGQIEAWGVKAQDLPAEDVVGRLLNNGTFDTGAEDYDRNALVEWTYETGDPNYAQEELEKIRTTRAFISDFIEEQLGPEGDMTDFTSPGSRMGRLKLKPVPPKE